MNGSILSLSLPHKTNARVLIDFIFNDVDTKDVARIVSDPEARRYEGVPWIRSVALVYVDGDGSDSKET